MDSRLIFLHHYISVQNNTLKLHDFSSSEENNWTLFDKRLWQRNYYDHIIRSEKSLNYIREYIVNNPIRWEFDKENPQGKMDEKENNFWKEINS